MQLEEVKEFIMLKLENTAIATGARAIATGVEGRVVPLHKVPVPLHPESLPCASITPPRETCYCC